MWAASWHSLLSWSGNGTAGACGGRRSHFLEGDWGHFLRAPPAQSAASIWSPKVTPPSAPPVSMGSSPALILEVEEVSGLATLPEVEGVSGLAMLPEVEAVSGLTTLPEMEQVASPEGSHGGGIIGPLGGSRLAR